MALNFSTPVVFCGGDERAFQAVYCILRQQIAVICWIHYSCNTRGREVDLHQTLQYQRTTKIIR